MMRLGDVLSGFRFTAMTPLFVVSPIIESIRRFCKRGSQIFRPCARRVPALPDSAGPVPDQKIFPARMIREKGWHTVLREVIIMENRNFNDPENKNKQNPENKKNSNDPENRSNHRGY